MKFDQRGSVADAVLREGRARSRQLGVPAETPSLVAPSDPAGEPDGDDLLPSTPVLPADHPRPAAPAPAAAEGALRE